MTRESYLSSKWKRYPFDFTDYKVCGRLTHFENNRLENNGPQKTSIRFEIDKQKLSAQSDLQKHEDFLFLEVGDYVALTKDDQLVLLSPHRSPVGITESTHLGHSIDYHQQQMWSKFLNAVRDFFTQRNFLEIQTSLLAPGPGPEPTIEVFDTEYVIGSKKKKLFLPTSPEIEIKKKLCDLSQQVAKPCVFEITRSFRNSEWTEKHRPEFFILEWYRTFEPLSSIQNDIVELVTFLNKTMSTVSLESYPSDRKSKGPLENLLVQKKSFKELFKAILDFDLSPQTTEEELRKLALKNSLDIHSAENFDDVFFLIYLHLIENQWNPDSLFFIQKYPPSQAALARCDSEGWGDRFEFYWKGFEIANAFCELNDPVIQKDRFLKDMAEKKRLGKKDIPLDQEFIQKLESGMPPTSGVALGLERLFMALMGIQNFSELQLAHIRHDFY